MILPISAFCFWIGLALWVAIGNRTKTGKKTQLAIFAANVALTIIVTSAFAFLVTFFKAIIR